MFDSPDGHRTARPAALAIAHPGHELRLTKWISQAKPTVHVLTGGSRSGHASRRVQASSNVLRNLGGQVGTIFGRYLDAEVYRLIMSGDPRLFLDLADELADAFVCQSVRTVVVDGWQLYNVVHDLWHLTVRAAIGKAESRMRLRIEVLDFAVVPESMAARPSGAIRLKIPLTSEELARKIGLSRDFPEIGADVDEVLRVGGRPFLEEEMLSQLRPVRDLFPRPGEKPLYEKYGEMRVAAGLYASVLRWEHALPIAEALTEAAAASEVLA
jgi:hypothetical protein